MEPTTLALICATVFGVVGILSAFIRQLLLSREKRLNDLAQQRALQQESYELEKIRQEMINHKRSEAHYQVLGVNKETIQYLDQRIEDTLKRKAALINRYAETVSRESSAIIMGESGAERKEICDKLKAEIDSELDFFQSELLLIQKRRASLWDNHKELLGFLVEQERSRDAHLDELYKQHSAMLEKVYLRHNENAQDIAARSIDASTSTFRTAFMAPVNFLMSVFKISSNIDPEQAREEKAERDEILRFQLEINSTGESKTQKKIEKNPKDLEKKAEDEVQPQRAEEKNTEVHFSLNSGSTV